MSRHNHSGTYGAHTSRGNSQPTRGMPIGRQPEPEEAIHQACPIKGHMVPREWLQQAYTSQTIMQGGSMQGCKDDREVWLWGDDV